MWGAIIGAVVAAIGMMVNNSQQKKQQQVNMDMAKFQADANQRYLDKQLSYNTPANQMSRFQDAGLNPNLIYGQGSPGNQTAPLTFPDIKSADYQKQNIDQLIPLVNQTRLTDAQVGATNAKTQQTYAVTALNKLQAQVIAKNPLLNDDGFKATIEGLKSAAALKSEQVRGQKIQNFVSDASAGWRVDKMYKEVQLLEQRFKLAQLDAPIKAEVLKSKEFQNAILEVQKKFMTDGDVTPQHILQFVQLLLMKAL